MIIWGKILKCQKSALFLNSKSSWFLAFLLKHTKKCIFYTPVIRMEKNTVQTSLLIKNADITITSVASFRNFIFVSAYGDKLLIYTIRKGI